MMQSDDLRERDTGRPAEGPRDPETQEPPRPGAEQRAQPGTDERAQPRYAGARESALLESNAATTYVQQFESIQATFVDDPREAVSSADRLLEDVMQRIIRTMGERKARIEGQWSREDDASTEDLRKAFHQYRSMFVALVRER
jgi:hypothetical protein